MKILAIDPGNELSGWVILEEDDTVYARGKWQNEQLLARVISENYHYAEHLAIEMPASYGMPVGKSIFDTCVWVGRFIQAFGAYRTTKIYRRSPNRELGIDSVCMHLCKSTRAKDANVRQSILDRFPATGGGKVPQVGTKRYPGPLYGVSKDIWSALAVGLTYIDWMHRQEGSVTA